MGKKKQPLNIRRVIDDLTGTADSLESVLEYYGYSENDLTATDYEQIDNEIFLCETCGWWCDVSELFYEGDEYEQVCLGCRE